MADILVKTPSMGKTVKLFSGSVSSGELIKFRESHSESGRLIMCMFLTTAIDGHLIQKQHFCHHGESICHTNSSYVASKLYGTSACGCNNNTVILKELFSVSYRRCMPGTLDWQWPSIGGACQTDKIAILLN